MTFGSVCSGIEAAQLAFSPFGFEQLWSSEISDFPSRVLEHHYPNIKNVGDMTGIPELILSEHIPAPDLFCGGTPCQAFSLAGWKNGLADKRGQLTITFIEIADAIDSIRKSQKKDRSIVLWENVEGVLNDRTNAFGNFIAGLAGFNEEIKIPKWSKAGYLSGPSRNVAWRVIDAKYFGLPQQRKRLYVLAGGKNFRPDQVLFEFCQEDPQAKIKSTKGRAPGALDLFSDSFSAEPTPAPERVFHKDGVKFEVFREYTDCLYSAYGTKWNGNAAAYNGSLYVAQNDRIRRFTPLECERLMGFPDDYTKILGNRDTTRYQAIGNSWAVPVVKWIASQINNTLSGGEENFLNWQRLVQGRSNDVAPELFLLDNSTRIDVGLYLNASAIPNTKVFGNLANVVETEVLEKFYLSPQACKGILRRKYERDLNMNIQLEGLLSNISSNEVLFSGVGRKLWVGILYTLWLMLGLNFKTR